MSRFTAGMHGMAQTESDLKEIARSLSELAKRASDVPLHMTLGANQFLLLKGNIINNTMVMEGTARKITRMSNDLEKIRGIYCRTEEKLAGFQDQTQNRPGDLPQIFRYDPDMIRRLLTLVGAVAGLPNCAIPDWLRKRTYHIGNSIFDLQGESSFFNHNISGNASASFDKNNVGAEAGFTAGGDVWTGTYENKVGKWFTSSGKVSVLTGAVTGNASAQLIKDGEWDPKLYAGVGVSAAGITGSFQSKMGNDKVNYHSSAEGKLGSAEASASVEAGIMEDGSIGVKAEAGAEAYLAEGKASTGFTVFGIDVDVGVSGKVGGAGVSGEFSASSGGCEIGGSVGALAGIGLELSIDWSDFEMPKFEEWNWFW